MDGARKGVWQGPRNNPCEPETTGRGDGASDGMWQRGTGRHRVANKEEQGKKGDRKRHTTAPWDWETSHHGVVHHGPTMGSLTTGSRENALNSGTAVRCP